MRRKGKMATVRLITRSKTNYLLHSNNTADCDMLRVKSAELIYSFSPRFTHWPQKCHHLPPGHQTHSSLCFVCGTGFVMMDFLCRYIGWKQHQTVVPHEAAWRAGQTFPCKRAGVIFFLPIPAACGSSGPGVEPAPQQWQCWILNPLGHQVTWEGIKLKPVLTQLPV